MKVLNSDIRKTPAAKNVCVTNTSSVPKPFPHKIIRPGRVKGKNKENSVVQTFKNCPMKTTRYAQIHVFTCIKVVNTDLEDPNEAIIITAPNNENSNNSSGFIHANNRLTKMIQK
ncbi:hypothetical protein LOAG_12259 [Loa loa]|uniref:Uncharacterized protein n=1 Tax=Loa loa TaxID=7209 RepID=A0A1S0TLM8_LOALO|nr:hypothetical protein LOAG_12259 [Loa loa]EFO16247.1 hypothetical protein LOAG_12259 [Loa loa]